MPRESLWGEQGAEQVRWLIENSVYAILVRHDGTITCWKDNFARHHNITWYHQASLWHGCLPIGGSCMGVIFEIPTKSRCIDSFDSGLWTHITVARWKLPYDKTSNIERYLTFSSRGELCFVKRANYDRCVAFHYVGSKEVTPHQAHD